MIQETPERITVTPQSDQNVEVEIGYQSVVIDKLFGPTVFANLRVTPKLEGGNAFFLIERQCIKTSRWVEWVTIPAQFPHEFEEDV